ncbi:MAG: glycosyltransferase family 4 protein [Thiohalomonadales bacterium]
MYESGHTKNRKKICIVSTVPYVLRWFMTPHIILLSKSYDVSLITNGSAMDLANLINDKVSLIPLEIERKVSPIKDIKTLIQLTKILKTNKFDCVHSIMPKSGLLAMVAGKLAAIPLRFHTFTGQVWANRTGIKRFFLKLFDKLLVLSSTHVFADSNSQRLFLINNGIVTAKKIEVLADGSISGVNINRFQFSTLKRTKIRQELNIPTDAVVYLFLGRLNIDKGIADLLTAFLNIVSNNNNYHLLIVGPNEDDFEKEFAKLNAKHSENLHRVGFTDKPEDYMSASDIFCMPSYREGFGSVIIEAATIGIPAIASKIYGITDAIEDGITGILHKPKNIQEITSAMLKLGSNLELRAKLGTAAKKRAETRFPEERLANAMRSFYENNLN